MNIRNKCFYCFKLYLIGLFLITTTVLVAQQPKDTLTKNYKFQDGLYFSYDDFKNNKPVIKWEDLRGNVFSNPQKFITRVEYLIRKTDPSQSRISLDSLWGFSLGGIPYLKILNRRNKLLQDFVGLKVRGKICYFAYEVEEEKEVVFSAYNPYTNQPFRSSKEKRILKAKQEKIMLFETGEILDYTVENMDKWLTDDPVLIRALRQISDWELEEKMFKCLLIYDDRHPVLINKTNTISN